MGYESSNGATVDVVQESLHVSFVPIVELQMKTVIAGVFRLLSAKRRARS